MRDHQETDSFKLKFKLPKSNEKPFAIKLRIGDYSSNDGGSRERRYSNENLELTNL